MKTTQKLCSWLLPVCLAASWNVMAQTSDMTNDMGQVAGTNNLSPGTADMSPALAPSNSPAAEPASEANTRSTAPTWVTRPLSLMDCLNLALTQNAALQKARSDVQANYGLVIQTRAVALPQVIASGQYKRTDRDAIENFPIPNAPQLPDQNWNAGIQIVQSIYTGGKMLAAVRAARLSREQALLNYQTAVQDTLLNTRVAYYDVLLQAQKIVVHDASVKLLTHEQEDQQRRYNAGTVPHFNVLRAEVAVANERPALIQAQNNYRIAKNNLANLLGYNLPRDIWEDIPLNLSDKLEAQPYQIELPQAIEEALANRTELAALQKQEGLEREGVVSARAGYKPTVSVFGGYSWNNSQFTDPTDLGWTLHGWNAGAEFSWNIFDGLLTRGKVIQARALYQKSRTDVEDRGRQIELEVRTAYSQFIEASEVLDSQKTVQAEAEEALREAQARTEAGTGTQLDVLDAQTSLTQARTTEIQALHDYAVARAKLQRAIGADMAKTTLPKP